MGAGVVSGMTGSQQALTEDASSQQKVWPRTGWDSLEAERTNEPDAPGGPKGLAAKGALAREELGMGQCLQWMELELSLSSFLHSFLS